jgi:hypothetical protein
VIEQIETRTIMFTAMPAVIPKQLNPEIEKQFSEKV